MLLTCYVNPSWERQGSSQLISKPVKQVGEKSRSTFARVLKKNEKMWNGASWHIFYRYKQIIILSTILFEKIRRGNVCIFGGVEPDLATMERQPCYSRSGWKTTSWCTPAEVSFKWVPSPVMHGYMGPVKNRILPQLQFIRPFIWVTTPFRTSRG